MYPKHRYSPLFPRCVTSHRQEAHCPGLERWGTPPTRRRKKKGFLVSNLVMVDFAHVYIWLLIMEIVIIWAILLEKISIMTVCTKWLKHQLIFYIWMYTNRHTLNISSFKNKDASNHLFKSFTWSPRLPLSIGDSHLHPFWVFLPQSVTLRHPIEPQGQEERSLDCSMVGCVATS